MNMLSLTEELMENEVFELFDMVVSTSQYLHTDKKAKKSYAYLINSLLIFIEQRSFEIREKYFHLHKDGMYKTHSATLDVIAFSFKDGFDNE